MRKNETNAAAPRRATKPTNRAQPAEAIRSATEYLIATHQAERALKAGNCTPPFRLRDQRGVEVGSETLLGRGPLVITFYIGSWCPRCSRDLQAFEALRPSIEAHGAALMAVSHQTVAENAKAHEQLKLGFPILSDRGGRGAQLYGVRWCIPEILRDFHKDSGMDLPLLNGDSSWTLPIPSRFVMDRTGVIVYSEINPGQSGRSSPRDILPVLDQPPQPARRLRRTGRGPVDRLRSLNGTRPFAPQGRRHRIR
jgi:peroxiredoxin